MTTLLQIWRNVFGKNAVDRDLAEEMQCFAEMLAEEKSARGLDQEEARRAASIEIGGIEQVKEQVRAARRGATLDGLMQDARHAIRSLWKTKAFTLLCLSMLTVGIAAATVIFSVFYAALLQPLPFKQPDKLVQVWESRTDRGWAQSSVSELNFWDLRARNHSFEQMEGFAPDEMNMTGAGDPEHLVVGRVSAGFFANLGVAPVLGRLFLRGGDQPGHRDASVLLANKFWHNRFGGSLSVLGRTLRLDGNGYVVAGVLPPGQPWLDEAEVFIPMFYTGTGNRGSFELSVVGRLRNGVTAANAAADLQNVCQQLARQYPQPDAGMGVKVTPASDWGADRKQRRAFWMLLGAVGCLLLIVCANVANLLLARATTRRREFTLRAALGASRLRTVRLVLIESLLLSLLGGALAVCLATAVITVTQASGTSAVPHLDDLQLNGPALAFSLLVTVLISLLSGILPALQAPAVNVASVLREGDRSQAGSRMQSSLRSVLVTVEVALALVLLIGAGLTLRSLDKLLTVDRGFETERRIATALSFPGSYNRSQIQTTLSEFLRRSKTLPQVVAVAATSTRPITGLDTGMGIDVHEKSNQQGNAVPWASWRFVTADYFRAMGVPLLRGRIFNEHDVKTKGVPQVALISQKLAEQLWPGEDAVGHHADLWKGQGNLDAEIVGVVGNTRDHGLERDGTNTVYLPYFGTSWPAAQVIVQTRAKPQTVLPSLRRILHDIAADVPLSDGQTMDEVVNVSLGPKRLNVMLLSAFAAIALLLAAAGVYGVLAYSVSRRTAEIGVRLALGASHRSIFTMVIREGLRPIVFGMAIGVAVAAVLSQLVRDLLFQLEPLDVPTYLAVSLLILLTALLSCYLPARRAWRIDPAAALREE